MKIGYICTLLLIAVFLNPAIPSTMTAQPLQIEISAENFDRSETLVSFDVNDMVEPGSYHMISATGDTTLLQVESDGRGYFVLDDLSRGEVARYTIGHRVDVDENIFEVDRESSTLTFHLRGKRILSYFHGLNNPPEELDHRYRRSGYIHPVYSPGGTALTNHLDVSMHPHHSGIWSAWPNTEFERRNPDFWNVHLNSGRVDQIGKIELLDGGEIFTGFRSKHRYVDLSAGDPVKALEEEWTVRIYGHLNPGYFMFDLETVQKADPNRPLHLPEYRYGGVAFRGSESWNDPERVFFLTSDGQGREGDGSRIRWLAIYGKVEGSVAGIVIMDHPSNVRYPQPIRIHPETPYVNFSPVKLGSLTIENGKPYRAKYRYVTFDGEPNPERIERIWRDYAYPPDVQIIER